MAKPFRVVMCLLDGQVYGQDFKTSAEAKALYEQRHSPVLYKALLVRVYDSYVVSRQDHRLI